MKDVRFCLEFPNRTTKKRSGREHRGHSGNVFAAFDTCGNGSFHNPFNGETEGLGAVYFEPNSPVAHTSADRVYFGQCKRIPEVLARKIHPALFERLDSDNKVER